MSTRMRWGLLAALLVVVGLVGVARVVCLETWWSYGLVVKGCPDGEVRQLVHVRASNLMRKSAGDVTIGVLASFVRKDQTEAQVPLRKFDATLTLVDAAGKETPLPLEKGGFTADGGADTRSARLTLPDVPDGDYRLRARVRSKLGEETVDVPLALYAPARVHVLTDRPLYEPGHTVRFRAVAVRARDLAPLDGRPGVWIVKDPTGEVLLEEKAPAGAWGVVAGSFPIDAAAAVGDWHVAWSSAGATDEVSFRVAPFTLPRFRVEARALAPYYRVGERPIVTGAALYGSGAPVAGAPVELRWSVDGEWPAPTEWVMPGGLLPAQTVTGPAGTFRLELPPVPADLIGQATLQARIEVTDASGDRQAGGAQVLLSKDGIAVSAVTELDGGLVDGFNNRVYLRVTTPDGRPLPGAKIHVTRAWSARDKGVAAVLDEDGVGSLQLDPGPPVNVVIPAPPHRPPPPRALVKRTEVRDALSGEAATLEDQLAVDRWLRELEPCALLTDETVREPAVLIVEESGAIASVVTTASPIGACLTTRLTGKRLAAGAPRVLSTGFYLEDPDLPRLRTELDAVLDVPDELGELVARAALAARSCLPPSGAEGPLPRVLVIRARAGRKELDLRWARDTSADDAVTEGAACVETRLRGLALATPAEKDGLATVHLDVEVPERMKPPRPQPTVMLGYELLVRAEVDGAPATKLRLGPGSVPPLRLRATPVLARPGDTVSFELIRGPDFTGTLPETLVVEHLRGRLEAKVDKKTRTASVVLDAEAQGFCEARAGDARALVFVRPAAELAVTVTPDRERYAPGQTAELAVTTRTGGQGAPAAVGLFGVDESLAQLAPLPGADELGRLRPLATMSAPAFDVLDAQALALGRVRGAHAAAATVLRVTSIPSAPDLDAVASGDAMTAFDPAAVMVDRFYTVLAELHTQARRWEAEAPPDEKMTPATMVSLWKRALDACAQRGDAVDDAYGRRLRLSRLPADLLVLADPRAVIAQGTRLPEDIESWTEHVAKVKP